MLSRRVGKQKASAGRPCAPLPRSKRLVRCEWWEPYRLRSTDCGPQLEQLAQALSSHAPDGDFGLLLVTHSRFRHETRLKPRSEEVAKHRADDSADRQVPVKRVGTHRMQSKSQSVSGDEAELEYHKPGQRSFHLRPTACLSLGLHAVHLHPSQRSSERYSLNNSRRRLVCARLTGISVCFLSLIFSM